MDKILGWGIANALFIGGLVYVLKKMDPENSEEYERAKEAALDIVNFNIIEPTYGPSGIISGVWLSEGIR